MVICPLRFAHQYQMGSGVRVLNLYSIPLGFNGNEKTSKGDFEKNGVFFLTLSSSPLLPNPTRQTLPFDACDYFASSVFAFSHLFSFLHFSSLTK